MRCVLRSCGSVGVGFDALAARIDVCETRIGADPETVAGIDRKRTHGRVIGERAGRAGTRSIVFLVVSSRAMLPPVPIQIAPSASSASADTGPSFGGGIIGGLLERAERVAVVALQTRLRSDPQKPGAILHDRIDRILREALIAADGLEVEVAAQWFAAGLCRQSCSQQQHRDARRCAGAASMIATAHPASARASVVPRGSECRQSSPGAPRSAG